MILYHRFFNVLDIEFVAIRIKHGLVVPRHEYSSLALRWIPFIIFKFDDLILNASLIKDRNFFAGDLLLVGVLLCSSINFLLDQLVH